MSDKVEIATTESVEGDTIATLSNQRMIVARNCGNRWTGKMVAVIDAATGEDIVVRHGTSHRLALDLAMEKIAVKRVPRRTSSLDGSRPLHRAPSTRAPREESVRIPLAMWTLETKDMGVVGIYDNEQAAKGMAEIIACQPLTWSKLGTNTQFALEDDSQPETTTAYSVTMHGVLSEAGQLDPLRYGTSAATEPLSEEQTELAGKIHRILAHQLNHGIGNASECPVCDASPDPFRINQ